MWKFGCQTELGVFDSLQRLHGLVAKRQIEIPERTTSREVLNNCYKKVL